jgi:adenine-specific DNA-methyltransferase
MRFGQWTFHFVGGMFMNQFQELKGIRMEWSGNRAVLDLLKRTKPCVLTKEGVEGISYGDAECRSDNYIIEGDNLQVMASLYKYKGKIDLIYADPPYNTGNKDFLYNDRWLNDPNDDDPGEYVNAEDAGRHTKWLNFMAPRLHMMKQMLKNSGVIAISIDEREFFRLGMLMDDIFGEENRLGIINWQKKYAPSNDSKHLSPATEYVLVYAKNEKRAETGLLERTKQMDSHYSNPDNDPGGLWRSDNASAKTWSEKDDYGIQNPFNGEILYPPPSSCWRYKKSSMKQWLEEWGSKYVERPDHHRRANMLVIEGDLEEAKRKAFDKYQKGSWPFLYFPGGKGRPTTKRYLNLVKQGRVPMTYLTEEDYEDVLEIGGQSWDHEQSGHTQDGRKILNAIMGGDHGFSTPKPLKLIKKIIHLWCPPNGIVLDPFAGSGTTAHAILELNNEIGTNRKFILIEQGNPKERECFARTLTADRVMRVISGNWFVGKQPPLYGGFTFKTKGQKIDENAIMRMQRDELIEVISQADDNNAGRASWVEPILDEQNYEFLFGKNKNGQGVCLLWDDRGSVLTKEAARAAYNEVKQAKLKTPFRIYGRSKLYSDDSFVFLQIPDEIINQLGVDE